jgi:hypothetical protein
VATVTEVDGWGWFTHTHDPRGGIVPATLFVAETALALGLLIRVVAHTVASGIRHPDGHPYDVRYGLGLGWHVRDPQPPWSDQLATAALVGCATAAWAVSAIPRLTVVPGLVAILAANLAVIVGDPVWLLLDRYT